MRCACPSTGCFSPRRRRFGILAIMRGTTCRVSRMHSLGFVPRATSDELGLAMNWGWLFGGIPLLAWLYLLLGRGFFWLLRERDDRNDPFTERDLWPSVIAIVPARNEADVLARSLASLLQQNYPGSFRIVLVDDQSSDGTADIARSFGKTDRLEIVSGSSRPTGWTGKPWAMNQGVAKVSEQL